MNLDFQWINYEQEPADVDDKKFLIPSIEEEIQSIYKISSVNKYARRSSGMMMKAGSSGIIGDDSTGGGEIINVQGGGRIIKATGGRKDRHSKVYTSKGPRDRRVRLSAHTAIQFYDVQDRLGYDRPSKAVDWLINKAKEAIDKLSSPPPPPPPPPPQQEEENDQIEQQQSSSTKYAALQLQRHLEGGDDLSSCSSLLMPPPPPPPDSMMKTLFPMSSCGNNLSRTGGIHQSSGEEGDLGLSLQTMHEQFDHEVNNNDNNINGFIFNSHSVLPRQQLFYNSPIFSQTRESNNYHPHIIHPSSWNNDRQFPPNHETAGQSSLFSVHFGSNFQVPARIHGEDDHEQQPSSISQGSQQL